jgi:anti-sigma factor ChrR (cupin superfamily)
MPNGIQRALNAEEMAEYVKPFASPGEDRRPTLSWARQVPINGHPADVDAIVCSYGRWLARSDVPKLFINADPGALLTGRPRELCRTWPNQTEVTVAGKHFVPEDSPDQIGQAIRHFVHDIRLRDGREETLMPGPPTRASAEPRKPAANATPPAPARAPRFSLEAGVPDRSAFPRAAWQTELRRALASAPDRLASPDREPAAGQANPLSLAPIEGETAIPATEPEPADCLRTEGMPWIATSPGKSFRPLRFDVDGWSELMRLEPGSLVARHRHTGDVHAFNLSGSRRILESGEVVGPGDYVYEPAGLIDAWEAVGDRPCIVHIKILGAVEYLDDKDQVIDTADAESQRRSYLTWCEEHHTEPVTQIIALTSRDEAALPTVAGPPAGA